MSTIVTRAGKGSPLTNNEVDSNFTNLNSDKVESITSADGSVVVSSSGTTRDLSVGIAGSTATLISQVRNETGATLTKGTVVYISGASGNKAVVSKALATSDSTSAQTYGMVQADIPNNQNGYVVVIGAVSGLNTSAFTDGTQLYLSGVSAGGYTNTKPYAPTHLVYVGVVTYSHATQGTIQVKIQNGYEMDELHDVAISSPATGQILVYNATTSLWSNSSVLSSYLPLSGGTLTGPLTISGPVANRGLDLATSDQYASMRVIQNAKSGDDGMYIGYQNANSGLTRIFGGGSGSGGIRVSGSGVSDVSIAGSVALNASNYSSYALPLSGGTMTGVLVSSIGGAYGRINGVDQYHSVILRGTVAGSTSQTVTGADVMEFIEHGGIWNFRQVNSTGTNKIWLTINQSGLTWNNYAVLDASNYTTYAPTLTGTGASGTWGISITGSAAQLGGAAKDVFVYGDGNNLGSFNTFIGDGGVGANNISRSSFYRDNNSHFGALGIHVQHANNSGYAIQMSWSGYDAGGFAVRAKQAGTWGSPIAILTANTYSSYALPLVGGTVTGRVIFTGSAESDGYSGTIRIAPTGAQQWGGISFPDSNSGGTGAANNYWFYGRGTAIGDRTLTAHIPAYTDYSSTGAIPSWGVYRTGAVNLFRVWADGSVTAGGNQVLHAGNYTSYRGTQLVSPNGATVVAANSAMPDAGQSFIHTLALGPSGNDGHILGMSWANTTSVYGAQIWLDTDPTSRMAVRSRDSGGAWFSWYEVLTSGNYNNYSPTLTGGNASGTWGISVTGSAGSVNGYGLNQTGGANTIVQRDSNGYIQNNYFYSSGGGSERNGSGLGYFAGFNSSDYYIRSYTPAAAASAMGALTTSNYSSYALPLSGGTLSGTVAGTNFTASRFVAAYGNVSDNVNGAPWYGMGDAGNLFGGGNTVQLAGYFGLRLRSSGTLLDLYPSYASLNQTLNVTGSAIRQGNNLARPLASWGVGGDTTGMVIFKLPGSSGNYGMLHMVFDIYEYSSNSVSTVIVGGHNWASNWYNTGASVIGQLGKQVRLGYKDGQYCVVFGDSGSVWTYGQIVLRKIQNGAYYDNVMDLGAAISVVFTSTESFTNIGGDLRQLRTPASFNAGGAITQAGNQVLHAGNYTSYALPLGGGTLTGQLTVVNSPVAIQLAGGYYIGQGSWGLRNSTPYGYIEFGPANGGTAHIYTDRGSFYFNVDTLYANGNVMLTTGNYKSYDGHIRALGYASSSNDWNSLGNSYGNSVIQVDPSNFSSTSNGPTAASYTYGNLLNLSSNSSSQAQIFISHAGNDLIFRGGWGGGSWQAWNKVLTNQNYTSYAVAQSEVAESGASKVLRTGSNGYLFIDNWIRVNSGGLYSSTNSAHFFPNTGSYGAWQINGTRDGWRGINFDNSVVLMMNDNESGHHKNGYGWQFRWQDGTLHCHKGSYGGGTDATVLDSANYTSYSPSLGGSGASGTWGISVSGNSAGTTYMNSSGYGDGTHTWRQESGTFAGYSGWASYLISNHGSGASYYNQTIIMPFWGAPQYSRLEGGTFRGPYTFLTTENYGGIAYPRATRANGNFYIDDNYGCGVVGTYSSYRYQGVFAMGDSYKLPADGTSTGSLYGMAWSHPNAGGTAGNLSSHGLLLLQNGGFMCALSTSIVASANVTAYSDERLKTNWRDMPENFVARLAQVKVGIYDRIDGDQITQVGVGAQSFQNLLPEAITTANDDMGTLSVSYGNAALASAVELAKDNVELRARIERLESLISKLIGD